MDKKQWRSVVLLVVISLFSSLLVSCATTGSAPPLSGSGAYNVLVLPSKVHPWAAPQISSALADHVSIFNGTFIQAINKAKSGAANGILVVKLDTSSVWETGRVDCFSPTGSHLWHEKVFFNMGGGEESIAHKFADELAEKLRGKHCGVPST